MRLKKFTEEKQTLRTEIEQLHQQLINAKTQRRSGSLNGPVNDEDYEDAQRKLILSTLLSHKHVNNAPFASFFS